MRLTAGYSVPLPSSLSGSRATSLVLHRSLQIPERQRRAIASTSTAAASTSTGDSEEAGQDDLLRDRRTLFFYLDTIFPIKLVSYDPRYLVAQVEKENLLNRIKQHLPNDTGHGFRIESVEAREKDGGAFVKCSYVPEQPVPGQKDTAVEELQRKVVEHYNSLAERPWYTWRASQIHLVQGKPWREDILNRFPSSTLRVEYESGPDLTQEQVFSLLRPYGRIRDLDPQPKFANVSFTSVRAAAAARNCLYGYQFDGGKGMTTLRILYKERIKGGRAFRDWMTTHPRIVIPILAVLAGGLSYAIFDPIRAFFVRSKVEGLFNLEQYRMFKWLKRETVGRLGLDTTFGIMSRRRDGAGDDADAVTGTGIEREREEAAEKLGLWIKDMPDTFVTVTGPPGSGKSALISSVVGDAKNVLQIDCSEIVKAGRGSEAKLVGELASQLGYFPQFQWASSFNNLIDIASVGLIGTKAGLSTNLDVQIKQVLDVAASALKSLADDAKRARERSSQAEKDRIELALNERGFVENVRSGWIHDGRLDCVAANGVMGELGMGIEKSEEYSQIYGPASVKRAIQAAIIDTVGKSSTADIDQIPVVVIRGFDSKDGKNHEVLWTGLADWAATLVENRIAHCIFVNDTVAVSKSLARALPSKPFSSITLTDATSENALQYVQKKLKEYGKEELVQTTTRADLDRLGGRLTDLETLIQKMRGGATVNEAVDDIIARSSTEIIKNCFGDDPDEAKTLPWTREQVWYLVKALCKDKELNYAELLVSSPFKDNEKALRALEQNEVITVLHKDGQPSFVRPGKPSYRAAFQSLYTNPTFRASNELALNAKAAAAAQANIKSASEELISLSQLFTSGKWTFGGTHTIPVEISYKVDQLLAKMGKSQQDLLKLAEDGNKLKEELKKVE